MSWCDRATGPLFRPIINNVTKKIDKQLTPQAIFAMIVRRCRRAGITKQITPHSLRHTAAGRLVDTGVEVLDVQRFLGHSDVRTTMRYVAEKEDLDNHAAHKLAY